ncbi:conserved hypothetical protein [Candidatus Nitrosotenuis uzonensis]|uniref:Uncharacterized protein n=1 Tax=Candidatus Nitrosotenuis uzonensis TaxID=1407055 RepID=A0A812F0C0_9ARCH|nr:conserved hypothetical protein [Candidatus Nitrosotenuis uzonensis]
MITKFVILNKIAVIQSGIMKTVICHGGMRFQPKIPHGLFDFFH